MRNSMVERERLIHSFYDHYKGCHTIYIYKRDPRDNRQAKEIIGEIEVYPTAGQEAQIKIIKGNLIT
jgi:hypothetical protein